MLNKVIALIFYCTFLYCILAKTDCYPSRLGRVNCIQNTEYFSVARSAKIFFRNFPYKMAANYYLEHRTNPCIHCNANAIYMHIRDMGHYFLVTLFPYSSKHVRGQRCKRIEYLVRYPRMQAFDLYPQLLQNRAQICLSITRGMSI